MSWVAAGMAALGVVQGLKNEKKADQARKERGEIIRYSPWTKMQDPGLPQEGPGPLESGVQGAFLGSQIGGKIKSTPNSAPTTQGGGNMLGGQDMSNQLAQQYGQESLGFDFKPRYLSMK